MRRKNKCGRTVETDQAERAKAVAHADGGGRYKFVLRRERMEMRDADRLREKQYRGGDTGYCA